MFNKRYRERLRDRKERRATADRQSSKPPNPIETSISGVESVSKKISTPKKPSSKNIRERFDENNDIEKQIVGNFEEIDKIRLFGEYTQNFVDVPKYDLSKINVIQDDEVDFGFILCLKDGEEGLPKLFATKQFYTSLTSNYNQNNPFGVNDIIDEKNIVVIDIKPLKEKVESLRIEELELDINLTTTSDKKYVEVLRNLFVRSNYKKDSVKGLEANPTYTDIELLRYITWVVSKPSQNYDDRLLPAEYLGDFKQYTEEVPAEDEASKKIEDEVEDNGNPTDPSPNLYPPIGRRGVEDEEEVVYNNKIWTWIEEIESWNIVNRDGDPPSGGGGSTGGGDRPGGGGPGYNERS